MTWHKSATSYSPPPGKSPVSARIEQIRQSRLTLQNGPTRLAIVLGTWRENFLIFNRMNDQAAELSAIANEIAARCAGRTDAECNGAKATAEQTLKELGAASAAENEWFRAMGFPPEV